MREIRQNQPRIRNRVAAGLDRCKFLILGGARPPNEKPAQEIFIQKLMFGVTQYAALVVFIASCWGFGQVVLTRLRYSAQIKPCQDSPARSDVWLDAAIAVTVGIGIFICVFQAFAIAGRFTSAVVIAMVALGIVAALIQLPSWIRQVNLRAVPPAWSWREKACLVVVTLTALTKLTLPLAPPAEWDELMYHLPYAREVMHSGSLIILEWIRYPWFPSNYQLLYAGTLMVSASDVFPHLLHALAGWTSVLIVYRLGVLHLDRVAACLGAAIWLGVGDYSSAYIDASVALFVLAACAALWRWRESPPPVGARWLALAAFFLGIAAGSKYQALMVLPLLGVFVLWHERRTHVLAAALLCFLIPCAYWYARNAIMTGDPFNPIGGRVFGFTNWNLDDYRRQFEDLHRHASLPKWLFWAALATPFSVHWKRSAALRAAVVFCGYSLLIWALTSRYPRYLAMAAPLLALTAGAGWQAVFGRITAKLRQAMPERDRSGTLDRVGRWLVIALLVTGAGVAIDQTRRSAQKIAVTQEQREAFLRQRVPGYAVMNYLREHATGRVYQFGLESTIYYGPRPIWGDWFGPWRYPDFTHLPPAELARKLSAQGFEIVAALSSAAAFLEAQPGFQDYFTLMYEKDDAKAYRIRPHDDPAP